MSESLPPSTDPAVLALCLDWLHDTLPWPRAPRYGWQTLGASGFTTPRGAGSRSSWRECEQCGGSGATRRGPCVNCAGGGGWHFDPMDDQRAAIRSGEDARPQPERKPLRPVRLSADLDPEQLADRADTLDRPLRQLLEGLEALRQANRYERAVLQRVHIIAIDSYGHLLEPERVLYGCALVHLGELMPPKFRAPRHIRVKAAGGRVGSV